MARPSTDYEPRSPAQGALYQIVRDHFETFRMQASTMRDGEGLPRFVEQAFRKFLQCGWLAGGFARLRCGDCGLDRLVPFSRKGALCPSCGGRRTPTPTRRVRALGAPGWPSGAPTSSITCSPTCRFGSAGVPSAAAALGWSGC